MAIPLKSMGSRWTRYPARCRACALDFIIHRPSSWTVHDGSKVAGVAVMEEAAADQLSLDIGLARNLYWLRRAEEQYK